MPEDYYPTEQSEEPNLPPEDAEEPKTDSETALMPKALLGDVAVGDTVTLKVVHIYEDEIEVEKVTEEPNEQKPQFESEIDEMSTEGE
jgi:hypothetical protein